MKDIFNNSLQIITTDAVYCLLYLFLIVSFVIQKFHSFIEQKG